MTCKYTMKQFTICTLVDITKTGQYRKEKGKDKEKSQQQNFDMIMQTIGMRTNASYISDPIVIEGDLQEKFGKTFTGIHKVWIFNFFIEHSGALTDELGNTCGLFLQDLHLVPIITGLDESATFKKAIFDTMCPDNLNTIVFPSNYKY